MPKQNQSYRETFVLSEPIQTAADLHGHRATVFSKIATCAARRINLNETSTGTPPADMTANTLIFEVRTNAPIKAGWQVAWQNQTYKILTVDRTDDLSQRITLAVS